MNVLACTLVFLTLFVASWARPNHLHKLEESDLERKVHGQALNKFERKRVGDIWTNCTTSSDMCSIVSVSISPDPPQKGKSITVTANFTLKEAISGGNVDVDLKADGFIPIKKTIAVCDLASSSGLSCPIPQTTKSLTITDTVPDQSAHITGQVTATDQNGKQLICVNVDFKI